MPDGGPESRADWDTLERSSDFQRLVSSRRRFVAPALIAFVLWYGGFLILTAYARDFMDTKVIGNFTWAGSWR